ncbi:MAG: DUF1553 domain-containing protein [Planctomycetota bacterium]
MDAKTPWLGALALAAASFGAPAAAQGRPFESGVAAEPAGRIDELVFGRLAELGIEPARLSSDAVFLRRAYLDVLGTLPTPLEARAFLADGDPAKRDLLIDRLLAREEYADFWAMRWGDLLRVKAEFPINLWPNAAQAYHRWIRTSLAENVPYDRFARELLTASGSALRVPPVNFWRAVPEEEPAALASAVALTFLGARADAWPAERRAGLAAFFSGVRYKSTAEWKEEIVYFDPAAGPPAGAVFPDGTPAAIPPGQDPRAAFADWLIAPENPWFARAVVNRLWFWLLGRGIVHPPDDLRPDAPPANPALLAYLERELVASGWDLKHVLRLILGSRTYQLSAIPRSDHPQAAASFACYSLRRLEAEVLIDALCQVTGTTEEYSSAVPEPFTYLPADQRAIAIPDASITSPFLELFARSPRDTGLAAERSGQVTPAQALHLLNSSHVQRKIEDSPRLRGILRSAREPRQVVNRIYLLVLSRYPTPSELAAVQAYFASGEVEARAAAVDLLWALVNTAEFLYRH